MPVPIRIRKRIQHYLLLDHAPNDLTKILRNDPSIRILSCKGSFSVVFMFNDYEHVIKMGYDPAYLKFVRWARNNSCPQLVKIFYVSHVRSNQKFAVVMEKLSENNDTYDVCRQYQVDPSPFTKPMKNILHTVFDKWNDDSDVHIDALSINFMRRAKTLVLTDPLYPDSGAIKIKE